MRVKEWTKQELLRINGFVHDRVYVITANETCSRHSFKRVAGDSFQREGLVWH